MVATRRRRPGETQGRANIQASAAALQDSAVGTVVVAPAPQSLEEDFTRQTESAVQDWARKSQKDKVKQQYSFCSLEVAPGSRKYKVRCLHCEVNAEPLTYNAVQATTSNLRLHLQRKHKSVWAQICPGETVSPKVQQRRLGSFYDDVKTHNRVVYAIIKDKMSLNSVERDGFRVLASGGDDGCWVPSRFWLSTSAIPAVYEATRKRMQALLDGAHISLAADGWKTVLGYSIWIQTVRWLVEDKHGRLSLREGTLDTRVITGSQTGPVIQSALLEQLRSWNLVASPDSPLYITTDRGSNILWACYNSPASAVREIYIVATVTVKKYSAKASEYDRAHRYRMKTFESANGLTHLPCLSHVLHRSVGAAIQNVGPEALDKISSITTAMRQSTLRTSLFDAWQKARGRGIPLRFKSMSPTRWHAVVDCISRFIRLQRDLAEWITETLGEREQFSGPDNVRDSLLAVQALIPTHAEVMQARATGYVLLAVKQIDCVAQVQTSPTGVKYARLLQKIFATLKALTIAPRDRMDDSKELVANFEKEANDEFRLMRASADPHVQKFARSLYDELRKRFSMEQSYDILTLGLFDPQMGDDYPRWLFGPTSPIALRTQLTHALEERVQDLYQGLERWEVQVRNRQANAAVSPPRHGDATQTQEATVLEQTPPPAILAARQEAATGAEPSTPRRNDVEAPGQAERTPGVVYGSDSGPPRVGCKRRREQLERLEAALWNIEDSPVLPQNAHSSVVHELRSYIARPDRKKQKDPLLVWSDNMWGKEYPRLAKLAKKLLTASATSIRTETTWSHAGGINTKKRTTLHTKTLDRLLFAQQNSTREDILGLGADDYIRQSKIARHHRSIRVAHNALVTAPAGAQGNTAGVPITVAQVPAPESMGNDPPPEDQYCMAGSALTEEEVFGQDTVLVDDSVEDVWAGEVVGTFDQYLEELQANVGNLTRAQARAMGQVAARQAQQGQEIA